MNESFHMSSSEEEKFANKNSKARTLQADLPALQVGIPLQTTKLSAGCQVCRGYVYSKCTGLVKWAEFALEVVRNVTNEGHLQRKTE